MLNSQWRINRLQLLEGLFHQRLEIGSGTKFNVPVRSEGCGTLLIGADNGFGYHLAPRFGSGEILLQPRTKGARIVIGKGNWFSNNISFIAAGEILVGDGCRIGDQVTVYDCDAHEIDSRTRNRSVGLIRPVSIGNNVWLGSRVMVLKGVSIAENTVVGAMSLVTRSLPSNCIAAGIPAKIIRRIE